MAEENDRAARRGRRPREPADAPAAATAPAAGGRGPAPSRRPQAGRGPTPEEKEEAGRRPAAGQEAPQPPAEREKKVERGRHVPVKQAVAELKKLKRAKFDETVEVHINLGIDLDPVGPDGPRQRRPAARDRQVRSGWWCSAQGDNVAKAKAAGADFAGGGRPRREDPEGGLPRLRRGHRHAGHDGPGVAGSGRCSAPAA